MPEIEIAEQPQQPPKERKTWKKRFSRKVKKVSRCIRKSIKAHLLCTSHVDDSPSIDEPQPLPPSPPVPPFASVSTQTEIPFIFDQLRHEGETMTHRSTALNSNSNNSNGVIGNRNANASSKSGTRRSKPSDLAYHTVPVFDQSHLPSKFKVSKKKSSTTAESVSSKPSHSSSKSSSTSPNRQGKRDVSTNTSRKLPSVAQTSTSSHTHHVTTQPSTSSHTHHVTTQPSTSSHVTTQPSTSSHAHHVATQPSTSSHGHHVATQPSTSSHAYHQSGDVSTHHQTITASSPSGRHHQTISPSSHHQTIPASSPSSHHQTISPSSHHQTITASSPSGHHNQTIAASTSGYTQNRNNASSGSALSKKETQPPPPPQYKYPVDSINSRFSHLSGNTAHTLPRRYDTSDYTSDYTAGHPTPKDSNVATREPYTSTPRERRRQEKKLSTTDLGRKSRDDFELPPVRNTVEKTKRIGFDYKYSIPSMYRSSSVAECLNYAGLSSPPVSSTIPCSAPSLFTIGARAAPLDSNTKEFVSNFSNLFSPTESGSASESKGYSTSTATTQLNSDKGEKSTSAKSSGSSLRKLSPKTKLYKLLRISRKRAMLKTPTSPSPSKPVISTTQVHGTQLSLDDVEAAYLNCGIAGFANLGNTCYMNSTVQCLSHTLEMTDIFLCSEEYIGPMCSEYKRAMHHIWFQPGSPSRKGSNSTIISSPLQSLSAPKKINRVRVGAISLRTLKDMIGAKHHQFRGFEEHDAQEFLRHLVGDLHTEMRPVNHVIPKAVSTTGPRLSAREQGRIKWESTQSLEGSPISDVFMGQFKSSLQCTACEHCSLTFESFWDMGLPLPQLKRDRGVELYQCISQFSRDEIMDGKNSPFCMRCCKPQRFMKKMTVQRFPPVLTIYLKRFSAFGSIGKLYTPVIIPKIMDLSAFASPEAIEDIGGNIYYELYAMINHTGSMLCGHYTADVKHFASQNWYTISDSRVTRFHGLEQRSEILSQEAYVLFYRW